MYSLKKNIVDLHCLKNYHELICIVSIIKSVCLWFVFHRMCRWTLQRIMFWNVWSLSQWTCDKYDGSCLSGCKPNFDSPLCQGIFFAFSEKHWQKTTHLIIQFEVAFWFTCLWIFEYVGAKFRGLIKIYKIKGTLFRVFYNNNRRKKTWL